MKWLLSATLIASLGSAASPAHGASTARTVLIVAGQSNVLNWHADAAALPPNHADAAIKFYCKRQAADSLVG